MLFKFGNFELDTDKRELRRDSYVRAVEPQVFNLLAFLIVNRDRIVTRDELLDAIWRKRIVSDSVIGSRINAARRADPFFHDLANGFRRSLEGNLNSVVSRRQPFELPPWRPG